MRTEHRVRDQTWFIIHTFAQMLSHKCSHRVWQRMTHWTPHIHTLEHRLRVLSSLSVSTWSSITSDRPARLCLSVCWVTEMFYNVITLNRFLVSACWACRAIFHLGNDNGFWPNHCLFFLKNTSLSFLNSRNKLSQPIHGSCFLFSLQLILFYCNISTKHKKLLKMNSPSGN